MSRRWILHIDGIPFATNIGSSANHPYYLQDPSFDRPLALESSSCFLEKAVPDDGFTPPVIALSVLDPTSLENSLDENVFYYFGQLRSLHPMLLGNGLVDVTYGVRAYAHAHGKKTN